MNIKKLIKLLYINSSKPKYFQLNAKRTSKLNLYKSKQLTYNIL